MRAKGVQSKVYMYDEDANSYAQDPATPSAVRLYVVSNNVKGDRNLVEDDTLRDGDRGKGKPAQGNWNVTGPLTQRIDPSNIGNLMKHLFGTVNTTGAGPEYTHEFTPGDLPTGFGLENDKTNMSGNKITRHKGCRVAGATFNIDQEGYGSVEFDIRGALSELDTAPLDATPTDSGHQPLEIGAAVIKENDTAIGNVLSGNIKFTNSLEEGEYAVGGEGARANLDETYFDVAGQLTLMLDASAQSIIERGFNHTETSLEYIVKRGTGDGTAGNEYFGLHIEKMVIKPTTEVIEGPRGLKVTVDIMGYSESGSFAKATLKNQLTGY